MFPKMFAHCHQAGSLVGLYLMEELCRITTLKKMPGKVAKAALKFPFVKSKVGIVHLTPCSKLNSAKCEVYCLLDIVQSIFSLFANLF